MSFEGNLAYNIYVHTAYVQNNVWQGFVCGTHWFIDFFLFT